MENIFYCHGLEQKIEFNNINSDVQLHMFAIKINQFDLNDVLAVTDYYDRRADDLIGKIGNVRQARRNLLDLPEVKEVVLNQLDFDKLPLSDHTYNCLVDADISTIPKLCEKTEEELKAVKGLDELDIDEIIEVLLPYGLKLADFRKKTYNNDFMAKLEKRAEAINKKNNDELHD
ncbi:MAG: hypothetical protein LUG66_01490 [Clostridiales bacterium]|nr:hypothetical protein [Clostridiales bacterium]